MQITPLRHRYFNRTAFMLTPPRELLGFKVNCGRTGIPMTIHPDTFLVLHIGEDGAPVMWVYNIYMLRSNYKDLPDAQR